MGMKVIYSTSCIGRNFAIRTYVIGSIIKGAFSKLDICVGEYK